MEELLKIKYITDIKVLVECIGFSNNPNNLHFGMFSLVSHRRKLICDKLGIGASALSASFKRLKDTGIIRGCGGEYQISYELMKYFKVQNRDKNYYTFESLHGAAPESFNYRS